MTAVVLRPWNEEVAMEIVVTLGLLLVVGAFVATLVHLWRTRDRVMGYHGVDTPRINETTHGGDGR